ncbi:MAG TPA: condensation domain-containing protein [Opitutaceae bacterium]|jgi:hypothetical protein|nr:condensation domain-containing protein [Opitutaceae bacterium]
MKSLPLTPLEVYLFEDDSAAYPGWQTMRMRWKGKLQRPEIEKAWSETTSQHPLLNAQVRRGLLGRLYWQLDATSPTIHWSRRRDDSEWPQWLPLDIERGTGVRLYVIEDDERADLVFSVHHAVCDGLSINDFAEDMMLRYAKALGDPVEPKAKPADGLLEIRGRMGGSLLERLWLPLLQTAGIIAESKLLRRTVAPIVPHVPEPESSPRPPQWPALVSREWTPAETAAIRDVAKQLKAGLPEMLMRDLQATVGAWRLAQGINAPDEWIRLSCAVSLRRKVKGTWPAANMFGIAIIDRSAKQLANRERLLRRAKEDMKLIHDWHFGYSFWMLLRLRRWWPGGIREYAKRPVTRMTLVMSFLGKVYPRTTLIKRHGLISVPGAVMEQMYGLAPMRPGTAACVDMAIVNGNFVAFLHYDPRFITDEKAHAFMDEFAVQLSKSVAGS